LDSRQLPTGFRKEGHTYARCFSAASIVSGYHILNAVSKNAPIVPAFSLMIVSGSGIDAAVIQYFSIHMRVADRKIRMAVSRPEARCRD